MCLSFSLSFFLSHLLFCSFPTLPHPLPSFPSPSAVQSLSYPYPPCFCGAVSVVDTMKTGRIHYLAPHSSPAFPVLPPYLPPLFSRAFNNEYIFSSYFFFHFFFEFASLCLVPIFPSLVSFLCTFTSFLFCSMHLSAND